MLGGLARPLELFSISTLVSVIDGRLAASSAFLALVKGYTPRGGSLYFRNLERNALVRAEWYNRIDKIATLLDKRCHLMLCDGTELSCPHSCHGSL